MHRPSPLATLPAPRSAALLAPLLAPLLAGLLVTLAGSAHAADLSFHEQSLDLPGAPAALIPADVDGDGLRDLAVVVVYTEWDQIGIEEMTTMDQVEGLVEVLTIVPTLLDRREVRLYRGLPRGGFAPAGEPLPLPLGVLSMEAGPPGVPVVALTDSGASSLRLRPDGGLELEPLVEEPPVLAGTGTFLAGLHLVADVTGDGRADLLVPAADGVAVYPAEPEGGLASRPLARVPYPTADPAAPSGGVTGSGTRGVTLDVPLPTVLDADGDGLPDLLFRAPGHGPRGGLRGATIALQTAPGHFAPPAPIAEPSDSGSEAKQEDGDRVWIGPVDLRPGAELVETESLDDEDAGMRKEMEQAREPRFRVRSHPLAAAGPALRPSAAPAQTFDVKGWVTDGGGGSGDGEDGGGGIGFVLPGGFQDLNGDGRADLVTVTNDITLFKAMSILATRRLTLELGFLAWCQQPDGGFVRAPGAPLTSKLTINLNDLEIRQRSLFAGDFDGDGRQDFLQLGRSREIGIHLGGADCSYRERPDVMVRLRDPLRDLALADALDLDGDGRSDLAITQPQPADEPGVSPPVRLDLYLSASPPAGSEEATR